MSRPTHIQFDLLSNARDSLRQGVELLAWKDIGTEHSRLKHAITNAAHSIAGFAVIGRALMNTQVKPAL